MRARLALCALVASFALAAPAAAQYGGYDLGPGYEADLNYWLMQDQALGQQINTMESQIVHGNMNDPMIQAQYAQYQAQGGQLAFPDYAYLWGATAGFTPQGIAYFMQTERDNARKEQLAYMGLLGAQAERAAAQGALLDSYNEINTERGNVLVGNGTYVDSRNGEEQVLTYMQPGVIQQDPSTGALYRMDNLGNYEVQGPDGYWYPMAPRY